MSEPGTADHIEHLLEHGLMPPPAMAHAPDWRTQQRIDLLLRCRLGDPAADKTFADIMATLSPERRAHLAAQVEQRLRPSWWSHLRTAGTMAAALLLAVGLAWLVLRPAPAGPGPSAAAFVATLMGPVDAACTIERDGRMLVSAAGMRLHAGDRLVTGGLGTVVSFPDGSDLGLEDATRLLFTGDPGKALRLDAGSLTAAITPQPPERPCRITTPHAQVVVVGTVFRLAVDGAATHLGVSEGRVRLTVAAHVPLEVVGGRQAVATPARGPVLLPAGADDDPLRPLDGCEDATAWTTDASRPHLAIAAVADRPLSGGRCLRFTYAVAQGPRSGHRSRAFGFLPLEPGPADVGLRFALRCAAATPRTDCILCVRTADGSIWRLHEEYFTPDDRWRTITLAIPPRDQPPYRLEGQGVWDPARITALAVGCNEGSAVFCLDEVMAVERR